MCKTQISINKWATFRTHLSNVGRRCGGSNWCLWWSFRSLRCRFLCSEDARLHHQQLQTARRPNGNTTPNPVRRRHSARLAHPAMSNNFTGPKAGQKWTNDDNKREVCECEVCRCRSSEPPLFSSDCDTQEVVHSALFSALSSVNEVTVVCGSEIQTLFCFCSANQQLVYICLCEVTPLSVPVLTVQTLTLWQILA